MAKQRRQNSIVSAIKAVTAALKIESIPNPTDKQKQQIHEAKVDAANIIENSTMITAGEFGDDDIAARITAEERAEAEQAEAEEQAEVEQAEAERAEAERIQVEVEAEQTETEQPPLET